MDLEHHFGLRLFAQVAIHASNSQTCLVGAEARMSVCCQFLCVSVYLLGLSLYLLSLYNGGGGGGRRDDDKKGHPMLHKKEQTAWFGYWRGPVSQIAKGGQTMDQSPLALHQILLKRSITEVIQQSWQCLRERH